MNSTCFTSQRVGLRTKVIGARVAWISCLLLFCSSCRKMQDGVSSETLRQVEMVSREDMQIPPEAKVSVSERGGHGIQGYRELAIAVDTKDGARQVRTAYLSNDQRELMQVNRHILSGNRQFHLVESGETPVWGDTQAPIEIVVFDDLGCPYCALLFKNLNSDVLPRNSAKVKVFIRNYPLTNIHPWAEHAAVSVGCLSEKGPGPYWSGVAFIHEHLPEYIKGNRSVVQVELAVDNDVKRIGSAFHLDPKQLAECIGKQDHHVVAKSEELGESLGLEAVPAIVVNGEIVHGAVTGTVLQQVIDRAWRSR